MTRKNTLKSLPTDTEFRVVGLDLAKSDVSVAAIPVDDSTPSLVDRMSYADLLDWARKISPTLFAMEPCNGYSLLCLQLENLGHEIKVINGSTVQCGSIPICQDRRLTSMMRSRWPNWQFLMPS